MIALLALALLEPLTDMHCGGPPHPGTVRTAVKLGPVLPPRTQPVSGN